MTVVLYLHTPYVHKVCYINYWWSYLCLTSLYFLDGSPIKHSYSMTWGCWHNWQLALQLLYMYIAENYSSPFPCNKRSLIVVPISFPIQVQINYLFQVPSIPHLKSIKMYWSMTFLFRHLAQVYWEYILGIYSNFIFIFVEICVFYEFYEFFLIIISNFLGYLQF